MTFVQSHSAFVDSEHNLLESYSPDVVPTDPLRQPIEIYPSLRDTSALAEVKPGSGTRLRRARCDQQSFPQRVLKRRCAVELTPNLRHGSPRERVREAQGSERQANFLQGVRGWCELAFGFVRPLLPAKVTGGVPVAAMLTVSPARRASGRVMSSSRASRPLDLLATIDFLGKELIVRSAANPKIRRLIAATESSWLGVIELEKCPRPATPTGGRDEGAPCSVTFENLAPGRRGDGSSAVGDMANSRRFRRSWAFRSS